MRQMPLTLTGVCVRVCVCVCEREIEREIKPIINKVARMFLNWNANAENIFRSWRSSIMRHLANS